MVTPSATPDRYLRQRDLLPPERLADLAVTVVGVGAIGRQVALQLAAIGTGPLTLVDFDTVELHNLPTQGYTEADLGRLKVHATAEACRQLNRQSVIHARSRRFSRSRDAAGVLFACVDSIETRRHIAEAVCTSASLFIDTRMSAEVLRILAVDRPAGWDGYRRSLFAPEQAHQGACTSRSTLYTASIAAGLAVGQFARWLRQLPVEADLMLNLLSSEMTVGASG